MEDLKKNWCSARMGGPCTDNGSGHCKLCKTKIGCKDHEEDMEIENEPKMIQQVAEGGWNEEWCTATMGGSCLRNENGVCEMCGKRRS